MTRLEEYRAFLARKMRLDHACGFTVALDEVNGLLKPHQARIVQWAVEGGRRAIFASFGLGKSVIQLEALRLELNPGYWRDGVGYCDATEKKLATPSLLDLIRPRVTEPAKKPSRRRSAA